MQKRKSIIIFLFFLAAALFSSQLYALTFETTNETGTYTWSSGNLTNTSVSNGENVTLEYKVTEIWNKTYNSGTGDLAYGVAIDQNNNVIITGYGQATLNYHTIKYNSSGNELWSKTASGTASDYAQSVATDSNNNIIVTGFIQNGISYDYFTIKYDSNGNHLWNKTYNSGNNDQASDVAIDQDNNVIITGYTGAITDFYTIKYNGTNGNEIWNKTFNGGWNDQASGVAIDKNNNIIVTGGKYTTAWYYYTIKYDTNGNELWNKTGPTGIASDVAIDQDNNVILSGAYIIKYDENGNQLWNNSHSGVLFEVATDQSNNIFIVGYLNDDYITIKYDENGNYLWNNTFNSGYQDFGLDIAIDKNNNILVTGKKGNGANDDYYTIKYKEEYSSTGTYTSQVFDIGSPGRFDNIAWVAFENDDYGFNSIAAGIFHSCGVLANGSGYCWGLNNIGQFGNGSLGGNTSNPISINMTPNNWTSITAGRECTCGILYNGTGYCWGRNDYGQLGNGSAGGNATNPTQISLSENNWVEIDSTNFHTCGIHANGSAYCWGINQYGQLGNGNTTNMNTPTAINMTPNNWAQISTGDDHTCGILYNGTGYCWGYNFYGQLGNGSAGGQSTNPQPISLAPNNWTTISTGADHTCGIHANGSAYCWGYNFYGQLGNGNTTNMYLPIPINISQNNWTQITAGYYDTCGILYNGTGYCWGSNQYGQLGNGSAGGQSTNPQPISLAPNNWTQMSILMLHTCGILTNKSAYCWGDNNYGKLGNGTIGGNTSTPKAINLTFEYTQILLQSRTSDDNISWSSWSSGLANPSGTIDSSARYIQYKAIFSTTNVSLTPILESVTIDYTDTPEMPSVSTQSLTSITLTSATANGFITVYDTNATIRGFKYGLTETDTWDVNESGNFGSGSYSLALPSLTPYTTYHVRAYATNAFGTSYGSYVQFTTTIDTMAIINKRVSFGRNVTILS